MKNIQINKIGAANNDSNNIVVLKISQNAYDGLEVSELPNTNASNEAETEVILIIGWVTPNWSERPILKTDYPQMGYVVYCENTPPP